MSNFSFNKIKQLDKNFYNFLKSYVEDVLHYENLLIGLQDLNKNHNQKRIVFITSECSDKGYICINCKDEEFENLLKSIEDIIKLNQFRISQSKEMIKMEKYI